MFTPASAPARLRHGSVGTPVSPFDEIRVYQPGTEQLAGPGELGELCCRGPYTIRGYYRAPERNAVAFTSDGFYRTGDIVTELPAPDGRRYFALADRIKDFINRGGEKVNAGEVEEVLQRHPLIEQAAVVPCRTPASASGAARSSSWPKGRRRWTSPPSRPTWTASGWRNSSTPSVSRSVTSCR